MKLLAKNETKLNSNEISIAIVTRNRSGMLSKCLKSLEQQSVRPLEVLVVDNCSTDETRVAVGFFSERLPVRYFYESKIGIPFARNRALKEARGKIIAFIDDDCEASRNWLEEVTKAHIMNPNAAAIQGKCNLTEAMGFMGSIYKKQYDDWVYFYLNKDNRILVLDTANASFKSGVLKKLGIKFDPVFKRYCDDIDICYQLLSQNQNIVYYPKAVINTPVKSSAVVITMERIKKGIAYSLVKFKWGSEVFSTHFKLKNRLFPIAENRLRLTDSSKSSSIQSYKLATGYYRMIFDIGLLLGRILISINQDSPKKLVSMMGRNVSKRRSGLVDIAVITRNRPRKLQRLLFSLLKQTVIPGNILVIDNGSSTKTADVVSAFNSKLPLKLVRENTIGIPFARNRALNTTAAKFLAFIDDDCEAEYDWVEEIIKSVRRHPSAAVIQGKSTSVPVNSLYSKVFEANYDFWLAINSSKSGNLDVADTKNLVLNTELLKKMNISFDRNFYRGSDMDLARQIRSAGLKIVYEPKVKLRHWERESLTAFLKQAYQSGRAQVRLDFKWPHMRKFIQEEEKIVYKRIFKNLGADMPILSRYLIRLLFVLYNRIYKWGMADESNFIKISVKLGKRDLCIPQGRVMPGISVGIITKDRKYQLEQCLFSLTNQTRKPQEVVIVDGSTDREVKSLVQRYMRYLPIKYIPEKRSGISRARNLIFKYASEEIICCIDDDCEAEPDWIEQMVKAHQKYPKAAAIQGLCRIMPFSGVVSQVVQEDYNLWVSRNLKDNNEFLALDLENASFKKSILRRLEVSYDDTYNQNYYCEDIDFGYQLLFNNQKIMYCPEAKIKVWRRSSVFELFRLRFLKGMSRAYLDFKWTYKNDLDGLRLKNIKIPFDKNSDLIRKIMQMPLNQKVNFFNPKLGGLPKRGFASYYLRVVMHFLHHKIYKYAYIFRRMAIYRDWQRLEKLPPVSLDRLTNRYRSLAVMIITKDRPVQLKNCLESLLLQKRKPNEVIIIDSSVISIKPLLSQYAQNLKIKHLFQNEKGFGAARNLAVQNCNSDIIATLDDDALPSKDWIDKIITSHNRFPEVLAIQGRIYSLPKNSLIAKVEQAHIEKWFMGNLEIDNNFTTISTKNVSFKTREFKKLKLKFKEDFLYGIYGSEDLDIANQILLLNRKILYNPEIIVKHVERNSLSEYLKQQYRKGYSNGLIAHTWKNKTNEIKYMFPFPKIFEPIYLVLFNPILRCGFLKVFGVLIIYYLADFTYMRAKKAADSYVKSIQVLENKFRMIRKTASLAVILKISGDKAADLAETLYSLAGQTIKPAKILIAVSGSSVKVLKMAAFFENVLPLEIIRFERGNSGVINNNCLNEVKQRYAVFIDDTYRLPKEWVENIMRSHKKYPEEAVINGRIISHPKGGVLSTISQFVRQNLIRDTMSGDRKLYWKWLAGELDRDFNVYITDPENSSFKLSQFSRKIIKVDSNDPDSSDNIYSGFFIPSKILPLHIPKIIAYRREKGMMLAVIRKGIKNGEIIRIVQRLNPEILYMSQRSGYVKRFFTFGYFCLRNKYLLNMPVLLIAYLLYQVAFYIGMNINQRMIQPFNQAIPEKKHVQKRRGYKQTYA